MRTAATAPASPTTSGTPTTGPTSSSPDPWDRPAVVLLIAGDIGSCDVRTDEAVAALIGRRRQRHPGARVVAAGDTAYPDGSRGVLRDCYGPSWGRHLDVTLPVLGNHDYHTPGAAGYLAYFRPSLRRLPPSASDPGRGWYAVDLGDGAQLHRSSPRPWPAAPT